MKLEEDFLTAEKDYNTFVMKNKVSAARKFFFNYYYLVNSGTE